MRRSAAPEAWRRRRANQPNGAVKLLPLSHLPSNLPRSSMCPHDARHRIYICDSHRRQPQERCTIHIFLRVRASGQKGEIRTGLQLRPSQTAMWKRKDIRTGHKIRLSNRLPYVHILFSLAIPMLPAKQSKFFTRRHVQKSLSTFTRFTLDWMKRRTK